MEKVQITNPNPQAIAQLNEYLQSAGVPAIGLYDSRQAWRGITWGIVDGSKPGCCSKGMQSAVSTSENPNGFRRS